MSQSTDPSSRTSSFYTALRAGEQAAIIDEYTIFALTDADGKILEANRQFCKISGYTEEELVGSRHNLVNSGYHSNVFWRDLWQTIKRGEVWRGKIRNQSKDNSYYWVHATIIPLKTDGQIDRFATIQTDISDTKTAEADLDQTRKLLEDTSLAAGIGGWVVDLVSNTLHWSAVTKEIHEVPPDFEPDLETAINFYKEGHDREIIKQALEDAVNHQKPWDLELQIVTAKETPIWVRAIGKPLFAQGRCIRLFGTFQNIDQQKREQTALRQKNSELHNALDAATQMTFIATDAEGLITLFNKGSEELLGYTAEEMVGKQSPAIIHLESETNARAEELSELLGAEVRGFETYVAIPRLRGSEQREWTYVRKDGSHVPVELTVTPVRDHNGALTGYLGVATDISRKKEYQRQLLESEQRFRGSFECSGLGMALVSPEGRWIEVNEALCQIVGYAESKLLKLSFHDITHPDDLEADRNLLRETAAGKRDGYQTRKRYLHSKGNVIWVNLNVTVVRDAQRKPLYFVSLFEDITERVRLENELQEVTDRLSLATRAARIGIWDWDIINNELNWDDQMFARYGVNREAFSGAIQAWYTGLHPDDLENVSKSLQDAIEGKQEFNTQFRVQWPDGTVKHLRAMATVERDTEGKALRMIGTNWDITELVAQRDELMLLADRARQATKAKSQFIANMSHEIRTPLNAVIGLSSLLLETKGLDEEQLRYSKIIKSSAEALLSLINDILDFSKVESGKLELEDLEFELRNLLDDFTAILNLRAEEKGLEFNCDCDSEVPNNVSGDPGRLRQILFNLAGNAIKFTSSGNVSVRVSLLDDSPEEVRLHFSVKDTGIGIPENIIPTLFDEFTQADASTTRLYGGSGLGLTISKQLAEAMGGEIGIDSREEQGSEFWFTARLKRRESNRNETNDQLSSARILTVYDNPETRDMIETPLNIWRAVPVFAPDSASALRILREAAECGNPIDIAIVDRQISESSGDQLARRIKSDPGIAQTRLILLTEIGKVGETERIRELGYETHITKPVNQSVLYNALCKALNDTFLREARALADQAERFSKSNARVLLVEDNVVNQMVARNVLEKLGLKADLAANGIEAIQAVNSIPYDLVLMDVQMPEMDGLEATRIIRSQSIIDRSKKIPIIAMTAHARKEDRDTCIAAGMNDYITKPVAPHELANILSQWLPIPEQGSDTDHPRSAPDYDFFDPLSLLKRVLNDEDLARQVIEASILDLRKNFTALSEALGQADHDMAYLNAHSIKGSARNAGYLPLAEIALAMETAIQSDDMDVVRHKMPELEDILRNTIAEAERYITTEN